MLRFARLGLLSFMVCVSTGSPALAQMMNMETLQKAFARDTTITLTRSGVKLSSYGYEFQGLSIEAILLRPIDRPRSPAILMIPGYNRTAVDYIPLGVALAKKGYVCLAVTQPGFGRSTGPPDFVGPQTIAAMLEGYRRLIREEFVDSTRMALFGYSRGAMAASLMAARLPRLGCVVLGGGIYDLGAAYREIKDEDIRQNIEKEAGVDSAAWQQRSSLFLADRIECPVLILHGEADASAPVSQAHCLHDTLTRLGKPSELVIVEGADHGLPPNLILEHALPFLARHLHMDTGE
jgi:dipeptidyl aminopeptidase/acylaminoacyl peptidase